MNIISKKFSELNTKELYEILKARAEIFIMEQNIHYQDMDNVDYNSLHCFFMRNDKVIAYLRAFYQYDNKDIVRIGRVLTLKHGNGIGRELIEKSLKAIKDFPVPVGWITAAFPDVFNMETAALYAVLLCSNKAIPINFTFRKV